MNPEITFISDEDIKLIGKILETRQSDGSDISKTETIIYKKIKLLMRQHEAADKAQTEMLEIRKELMELIAPAEEK